MGISTRIWDAVTRLPASIIKPKGEKTGFNVLTRPAKVYENITKFFVNEDNGADMAVDALNFVIDEWIHDGIDNVYWTASAISGTWTFNSAVVNHTPAGAQSVSAVLTLNGDTAQFLRGGGLLPLIAPISSIGIWIYVVSWSASAQTKEIRLTGWDTTLGTAVGIDVDLANYIDVTITGVWQHAIVPLGDMNLTGQSIDSIRVQTVCLGGPVPNYYLDDMQILQGSPVKYIVEPELGTWFKVKEIVITIVDVYSGIVTVAGATENATFSKIPYDSIFSVPALDNGIVYQRINEGKVSFNIIFKTFFDIIKLPGMEIVAQGSDGVNSWVKLRAVFGEPLLLKSETDDKLVMSLADDLSSLLEMQMALNGKEEVRSGDLYD